MKKEWRFFYNVFPATAKQTSSAFASTVSVGHTPRLILGKPFQLLIQCYQSASSLEAVINRMVSFQQAINFSNNSIA